MSTLTDDERDGLAEVLHTVAHDAPDVLDRVAAWVAERDAAREQALRAKIKADTLAMPLPAAPYGCRVTRDLAAQIAGGDAQ